MKKWIWILISLYAVAMVCVVVFAKEPVDDVSIITYLNHESRLVTSSSDEETIDLFLSVEDSFLTDIDCLESAYIESDEDESAIEVTAIENVGETVSRNEKEYHRYILHYRFGIDGFQGTLSFPGASLVLGYENGESIGLAIGSLDFLFASIDTPICLDFTRIYGIVNEIGDEDRLVAIVIGIEVTSLGEVRMAEVKTGIDAIKIDEEDAICCQDAPYYRQDLAAIMAGKDREIGTLSTGYYVFPIDYAEGSVSLKRAYFSFGYTYLGNNYTLLVDDFPFASKPALANANEDEISEYNYQYR